MTPVLPLQIMLPYHIAPTSYNGFSMLISLFPYYKSGKNCGVVTKMGCARSKEGVIKHGGRPRSRQRFSSSRLSEADHRLAAALRSVKQQMDAEQPKLETFSFTKIILKLGTIERVLKRVKAVFRSVDEGNKGTLTREELKAGLHMVKVDLGDEWQDSDIDECLEHLGGPEIGLREFVVMLAVGRVCRPMARSAIFMLNMPNQGLESRDTSASLRAPTMLTIDENDYQRPSTAELRPLGSTPALSSVTSAYTEQHEPLNVTTSSGIGSDRDGVRAAEVSAAIGGTGEGEGARSVYRDEDRSVSVGSGEGEGEGEGKGLLSAKQNEILGPTTPPVPASCGAHHDVISEEKSHTASAGPGGLPRGNSWLSLKWARIPSLRNLDTSGRSMSSSAGISGMKGRTTSTVGVGGGSMKPALGNEADLARSVKYVLDLFIAAYFQFDTTGQGYITKKALEKNLRQAERESGTSTLLDEGRWHELAWDEDQLSFQEFIYAFAQWLGLLEDEEDTMSIWSYSQSGSIKRPPGSRATTSGSVGSSAATMQPPDGRRGVSGGSSIGESGSGGSENVTSAAPSHASSIPGVLGENSDYDASGKSYVGHTSSGSPSVAERAGSRSGRVGRPEEAAALLANEDSSLGDWVVESKEEYAVDSVEVGTHGELSETEVTFEDS